MDQRCHTFLFGHYHQAPGASCGILYILVLSLVLFMQSLYPFLIYEIFNLLVIIMNLEPVQRLSTYILSNINYTNPFWPTLEHEQCSSTG